MVKEVLLVKPGLSQRALVDWGESAEGSITESLELSDTRFNFVRRGIRRRAPRHPQLDYEAHGGAIWHVGHGREWPKDAAVINCIDYALHQQLSIPFPFYAPLQQRVSWMEINELFVPSGEHIYQGVQPLCSVCRVLEYCQQVGVTRHR